MPRLMGTAGALKDINMSMGDSDMRQAQLDKDEREDLENVVTELRELVEAEIEYELEHKYDLTEREGGGSFSEGEQATRARLVDAIDHENPGDKSWEWCYQQYINGVGYTFINRLAALRCMEVRDFIDRPVTRIGESGLTPAAERVLGERFDVGRDEALIIAFEDACERFDDEIELLFDTNSPYTVLDLDPDTFRRSIEQLDKVPDEVWRADDVLGWVYEYYNIELLDDLRRKGDREGFEAEDVPPANQFYTPHWVVRMLTDNSLGKLYLEDQGDLQAAVEAQDSLTPDERKNRPLSPEDSPDIADFCTYLVPSEEEGEPSDFDGPEDIRIIDPACGSGHFLLYAFDVLERIYRAETDLAPTEIPREILRNNLYGVDLDMRACQLAAFNLYLKGRMRAEAEGANGFDMPGVGIVCADAKVADVEGVEEVFDEVADGKSDVEDALRRILDAFEEVHGLGSLLDVRGTLGDLFEDDSEQAGIQITLGDDPLQDHTLGQILHTLREAVDQHREEDSFLAQDLRSFVRLLDVLAQDYDVALMNPPYGSRSRMPSTVQDYVESHYEYTPEFYINFFEVCERLSLENGRIGMLVPRSFMFKHQFSDFRKDFIGSRGSFDFLAEYGIGVLDNATVRTVGTVVRSEKNQDTSGTFLRLHDVETEAKERVFTEILLDESDITRLFEVDMEEFRAIPRSPICYSVPEGVRELHERELKVDAEQAQVDGDSACHAVPGLLTGDDDQFARYHWEVNSFEEFSPISEGGSLSWVIPHITETVFWGEGGEILKRANQSVRTPNEILYGSEGLTWTYIKDTGRRFGYYPGGLFSHNGFLLVPREEKSLWLMLAVINSNLYHNLILSQTIERNWNAGEIGSIPWLSELEDNSELEEFAKRQYQTVLKQRREEPTSPYYIGPSLLPDSYSPSLGIIHPHRKDIQTSFDLAADSESPASSVTEAARYARKKQIKRREHLESLAEKIDRTIYDETGISESTREDIEAEIFLRTAEEPTDREVPDPESVPEVPENLDEQVKDLVHHFAMEAVRKESDGIIPLEGTGEQADMLDRIVERFEDAYGEYAEDRLVEVDDILGAESAADEAYPNLRSFIEHDLFAYHVDTMENTPILWKLSTERLVADSKSVGFACFVDYHQLDASLFDRVSAQYLEPRKAELRDRQSAADRRRNNESLTTGERANAAETFEACTRALQQIAELETAMKELGSTNERDFETSDRELVQELGPKVAEFREETAKRIDTLAELREQNDEEWFQDTFSDNFWNAIDEWRDEWLDALDELQHACEKYAKPRDEPVEAHLADLFDYFNWRLKGSDHYSSSGILFMTYYFEREGSNLLNEDGEPFEKPSPDEKKLASLAMGLDNPAVLDQGYLEEMTDDDQDVENLPPLAEYKALAEEIDDRCQTIYSQIPSEWKDRALSEITTAGYRPNHKHGVAINITPLADQNIVPEIVDGKVI